MRSLMSASIFLAATTIFATNGFADLVAVDEKGNGLGFVGNGFLAPDPGPGGLASVLTYKLTFGGTQGDVLISEPGGVVTDIIRFNGNGTVVFYSDNIGGTDAIADTPTRPLLLYRNIALDTEFGPEGDTGATYIPIDTQPGFDQLGITYQFQSDGTIPEPAAIVLLATVAWLLGVRRRIPS